MMQIIVILLNKPLKSPIMTWSFSILYTSFAFHSRKMFTHWYLMRRVSHLSFALGFFCFHKLQPRRTEYTLVSETDTLNFRARIKQIVRTLGSIRGIDNKNVWKNIRKRDASPARSALQLTMAREMTRRGVPQRDGRWKERGGIVAKLRRWFSVAWFKTRRCVLLVVASFVVNKHRRKRRVTKYVWKKEREREGGRGGGKRRN